MIKNVNIYSQTLNSFCNRFVDFETKSDSRIIGHRRQRRLPEQPIEENLSRRLKSLCRDLISADDEAAVEYSTATAGSLATRSCPAYLELQAFILNLSSFLNNFYSSRSDCIEPFQKQLILHCLYFLITIKSPEGANKLYSDFANHFGLFEINMNKLLIFKQKATVFLIPRRHGKTWIVVAILCMLLSTVSDLHLGYVAHQKHVANYVFGEITATLIKLFGSKFVEVKKENGLIIFKQEDKKKSTLLCATCFNKNVSITGPFFLKSGNSRSALGSKTASAGAVSRSRARTPLLPLRS